MLGGHAKACGGKLTCIEPKPTTRWHENITKHGIWEHVNLIRGESPDVQDPALPESIDLLLIDGVHERAAILADYARWAPLVRPGGVVVFHDWCGKGGAKEEVRAAVAQLLKTEPLTELARTEGDGMGAIAFYRGDA